MAHSLASRALKRLVRRPTQQEIAAQLAVTQQAVSSWINGTTRPDPARMAKLEELFGIPMRDWTIDAVETDTSDSGEHPAVDTAPADKTGS